MPKIYRYRKTSDDYTTWQPLGEGLIELCTLPDGFTYVSVPDDGKLADEQPEQVQLEEIVPAGELREQIKAASPHCLLIEQRKVDKIRAKYSAEDEMYFARISVGALTGVYAMLSHEPALINQYQADIEAIRQWGWEEKAKLGL